MSLPARNDPCPCGSGRKYKRCCQAADLAAEQAEGPWGAGGSLAGRRRAAECGTWEADVVPLPVAIEEAGSERPVMLLLTADDAPIHKDLLGRLGGEVRDVARALAKGLDEAIGQLGVRPDLVLVRHAEVRGELAPLLAARGIEVEHDPELPGVEEVALELLQLLGGRPWWPPIGRSGTWLGWSLPDELVAEIFEAAADFWEQEPWRVLGNLQAPRCVLPSGRAWTAAVLGNGGLACGLVLHSDHDDAFGRPGLARPELAFAGVEGRLLSLLFGPLDGMSEQARTEVTDRRWRLASPHAYPMLGTVNTPGGGVAETEARDLVTLLRALPRFTREHGPALEEEIASLEPLELQWTDAESGVAFRYRGEALETDALFDEDFDEDVGDLTLQELLERALDELDDDDLVAAVHDLVDDVLDADLDAPAPPGAFREGAMTAEMRAEFMAVVEEVQREMIEQGAEGAIDFPTFQARVEERMGERIGHRNDLPHEDFGGLSPAEMNRLLSGAWVVGDAGAPPAGPLPVDSGLVAVRLRDDLPAEDLAEVPVHEGVEVLLELARDRGGLDRTQAGNLKVDVVRAWTARVKDRVPEWAEIEKDAGERSWEHDVPHLHWLRLLADLDGWLSPRGSRYVLTALGRRLLAPGREGERYARLFHTCFRHFNLGYDTPVEWPEGQHQAAFTLLRLGHTAVEWTTPDTLIEEYTVAPFAVEAVPDSRWMTPARVLEINLLWPLSRFGLLERQSGGGFMPAAYRVTPRYRRFLEFGVPGEG